MDLPHQTKSFKYLYPFIVIGIVALFSQMGYPYLSTQCLWPDEALYSWYAKRVFLDPSLIFSKEIIEFHPPLFSVLLALSYRIFPNDIAYHFLPFLVNILGIILIYRLGTKIKDRFTGLCAAVNLAFNSSYIRISTHILIDSTLCVLIILLANVLLDFYTTPSSKPLRKQAIIGLIGAFIILLKWSGVLAIPFLLLYALFVTPGISLRYRLKNIALPLTILCLTAAFLLLNNFMKLGHLLANNTSAFQGKYLIEPLGYYFSNFGNIVTLPYLLPFFVFGLLIIFTKRNPAHTLLAVWFFVFIVGISLTSEKYLRYSLLILPAVLLICSVGLSALIDRYTKTPKQKIAVEWLVITILFSSYVMTLPRTQQLLNKSTAAYTGFKEAGLFIKKEAGRDTIIMAASPRTIRYYSGINFWEFGGGIISVPMDRRLFEETIENTPGPLIVEIDLWERFTQPPWLYPTSDGTRQYMISLGFQLVKVIAREVLGENGAHGVIPVIWIFKK